MSRLKRLAVLLLLQAAAPAVAVRSPGTPPGSPASAPSLASAAAPNPAVADEEPNAAYRVRSLSAANTWLTCLIIQSYVEGTQVAKPLGVAVAAATALATRYRPMLLRFQFVPLLQSYFAARLSRYVAKCIYFQAQAQAAPSLALATRQGAKQPVHKTSLTTHAPLASRPKKKVLILISDTGGGHRASAQALASVMAERHGDNVETTIVDVWTMYGPWPFGKRMVPSYRFLAKRPRLWYANWKATAFTPTSYLTSQLLATFCYRGFERCFQDHSPDVVVSMHPLCQAVPIRVLQLMHRRRLEEAAASKGGKRLKSEYVPKRVPFVTVVTDLATPHPLWLHPKTDVCFIPSAAFERAALVRGFSKSQLRQHGLPVRPAFASTRKDSNLARSLGLLPDQKTILVVGGGDGVGKLGETVEAMATHLAEHNAAGGAPTQMVVICGKNHVLRKKLREREWGPNLHVVVEGFVTRMPDYMAAADVIVTKAGPGTIAEACCCGLPIMLSGYLPGQETGNVGHVVDGGFGGYSAEPREIASVVTSWIENPELLRQMSERSLAAASPAATEKIADDILELVDVTKGEQPPPSWRQSRHNNVVKLNRPVRAPSNPPLPSR